MERKIKNLKYVFEPKSIAVIGATKTPSKVGNVLLKNFIEGKFDGKIYPVNPKYDEIMGLKCYSDVLKIKGKVESAVIATPAKTVPSILEQCGKKGIKGVIVLSGGFAESGNTELEEKLKSTAKKYNIALIGPNCLGVINPYSRLDSIFFPVFKLQRPKPGSISFVTQSGAVGSCIVDLAAYYGVGISKFISYGNASVLDESDIIDYLSNDDSTESIIVYIEGTKDGKKFMETLEKVNKIKPIVVLKAGRSEKSSKAAFSHTGNIAGNYLAYSSAFKQTKVIEAKDVEELFDYVKIFNQPLPRGKKIGIITDGGGLGVLTTDAIEETGLDIADLGEETEKKLKKILPAYANVGNPLDIIADADPELYKKSIDIFMDDPGVDLIIVIVLFQAPALDERLLDVLVEASDDRRKPIAVVAVGGDYTHMNRKILDTYGVPTFGSPRDAIKAIKKFTTYSLTSRCRKCIFR
ncbi:CoA-binding protein [Candidatus Micrarchaeota archaeon]|nr:CoA-binding protein [Candidatus Micrarchaeota archaeon]